MGSAPGDAVWVDQPACRTLADGLGTTGQELQTQGHGGAVVDGLSTGLAGAKAPAAYHTAARAADKAMGAVGTALTEMGGTVTGAVASFSAQDSANAKGIAAVDGGR